MTSQFLKAALAVALSTTLVGSAAAEPTLGTPSADVPSAAELVRPEAVLGNIGPVSVFSRSDVASAGVGFRNRGAGGIDLSGVQPPVRAAFIYWAIITNGPAPAVAARIQIARLDPTASGLVTLTGAAIGVGPTPCWSGNRITVFKAAVPTSIVNGNGTYFVRLLPGASGSRAGGDPWNSAQVLPLAEGASIVAVGSGASVVAIYDRGLAGRTWFGTQTYTLVSPLSLGTRTRVILHNIGADGQKGFSHTASAGTSGERSFLNALQFAGPGSPANDSDWNGGIANPLPQLWDNTAHDVTTAARRAGSGRSLAIRIEAPGDCLVPVANAVSLR